MRCLELIHKKLPLKEALIEVVTASEPLKIDHLLGFKLHAMGLVKLEGDCATPHCPLYREYFKKQLTSV